MGRLIPAGTGIAAYKRWKVVVEDTDEAEAAALPGLGGHAASAGVHANQ